MANRERLRMALAIVVVDTSVRYEHERIERGREESLDAFGDRVKAAIIKLHRDL